MRLRYSQARCLTRFRNAGAFSQVVQATGRHDDPSEYQDVFVELQADIERLRESRDHTNDGGAA